VKKTNRGEKKCREKREQKTGKNGGTKRAKNYNLKRECQNESREDPPEKKKGRGEDQREETRGKKKRTDVRL